ncbi:hypothetical protein DIZ27_06180 [Streptomyces sp. NWU339]|nr:hypothetical protein [Streptomyces sp. NWU339]PWI11699.1 hypothetical protein DIZ27_06180 [Streptomyces sp. NWU339]
MGLAGALVLAGCGGDGDSRDDSATGATPSTPATTTAPEFGGGTGSGSGGSDATGAPAGKLEGSWLTTAGGKAVALVFTGDQAALFAMGGTVCSGTAREDAGASTISLKCADGKADRASGTVDSVSGSTLKVTWESSLGTETFTKAEGGRLPQELPTAGPGS